jgi:hypothetical protein
MHIIVEGPDGAGKTRLVKQIVSAYDMQIAKRASTSEGGPIVNVDQWVEDVETNILMSRRNKTPFIFDRHAIISEPIYSLVLQRQTAEMFRIPWWVTARRQALYNHTLVVFCLPEYAVLDRNVKDPTISQMPGVAENIHEIYMRYIHLWQNWGGPNIRYDYTRGDVELFTQMIGKWVYL